ncbi:MAG: SDR family NAD(P)-dependent oxidoreductase [Phycisphaerales bacterium JB063]
MNYTNKTAVVTGAGSGIGRAIACRFAAHGAFVAALDIDADAAQATAELIDSAGGASRAWACDVTDAAGVRQTFDAITQAMGRLDVLVNNAGVASIGALTDTDGDELDRVYRVNVKGVYHCLHAAVPHMEQAGGGAILNLASIASLVGIKDRFAYSMSKGAVLTMTYSVAIDYIDRGIRCNCICPARIHTPFVDGYLKKHHAGHEQEVFDQLSRYQPIGRMGTPEEVAALAAFLCSDDAGFITGAAYPLDGGVTTLI